MVFQYFQTTSQEFEFTIEVHMVYFKMLWKYALTCLLLLLFPSHSSAIWAKFQTNLQNPN